MLLAIHPDNPEARKVRMVVEALRQGGIIIYPTDTAYAIGCSIYEKKAIERIYQIKQAGPKKLFSLICLDLRQISEYALVSDWAFRFLKRLLPGPYTLIMNATEKIPNLMHSKRKQAGVRVTGNVICQAIVQELGHPLLSTTAKIAEDDWYADAYSIHEDFKNLVDLVVDGGYLEPEETTVVDLSGDRFEIIREGKGQLDGIVLRSG